MAGSYISPKRSDSLYFIFHRHKKPPHQGEGFEIKEPFTVAVTPSLLPRFLFLQLFLAIQVQCFDPAFAAFCGNQCI